MREIAWALERLALNEAAAARIKELTAEERARLTACINVHEDGLDCSDGPRIAVLEDRAVLRDEGHTCCGWEETYVGDLGLLIGTCYDH